MKDFPRLAQVLIKAHKALIMYTYAHPQAQAQVSSAHDLLDRWCFQEEQLQVVVVGPKVFAGGELQDSRNTNVAALAKLLAERAVSGLIVEVGVSVEETRAFLEGLVLKPSRLDEAGGLEAYLRARYVNHIKTSQVRYQEVHEDENSEHAPVLDVDPALSEDEFARLLTEALKAALKAAMEAARARPKEGGSPESFPAADLGALGPLARSFGFGESMPSPDRLAQIRKALLGLRPEEQISVLRGLTSLPESPAGLSVGMRVLVGESLAAAMAVALSRGASWDDLQRPLTDILRTLPERQAIVRMVNARLSMDGQDGAPLSSALKSIKWETLPLESRLLKVLEEGGLYEVTHDMRLAMLRELLDERRVEELLRVLDLLMTSLHSEEGPERQMAIRTLAGVARWAVDPGLPADAELPLAEALRAHFAWEPDPALHAWSTHAVEFMLMALLGRGQLKTILADLQELEGLSGLVGEGRPSRTEAIAHLRSCLLRPHALNQAIDQVFDTDRDRVIQEVHPYLEALGTPMAQHLMGRLEIEPDRARRGRLVDAIRSLGPGALGTLLQSLSAPAWYLVRNSLAVLCDAGDAGCIPSVAPLLRHPDLRVRQAAIRALWKMGGPQSEPHLVARLKDADERTLAEVLFALGQLRAAAGLPQIQAIALGKRVPPGIRIQALEALGQIGAPGALPTLVQCLRRKRLFSSGEPPPIRMAAAKALAALGTPEAQTALAQVAAREPKGAERDSLCLLLDH